MLAMDKIHFRNNRDMFDTRLACLWPKFISFIYVTADNDNLRDYSALF